MSERPQYIDASTVISILPVAIKENKPGLNLSEYHIPAVRDPNTEMHTLIIYRSAFAVYIDENRPALIIPEPSDRIAEAICRDYRVGMSHTEVNVAEPGLFWLSGKREPSDILKGKDEEGHQLLKFYRSIQREWFFRLVSEADEYWSRIRSRRAISDLQRAACNLLNLKREWNLQMEVEEALSRCKFCMEQVHPNAIICGHCNGILDMPRYKESFVHSGVSNAGQNAGSQLTPSGTGTTTS